MDKVFTNHEYCAWLKEQARLKRPYWYGVYYLKCTEKLLKKKARQYPAHYADSRMATYREHIAAGQIAGDCVNGAIKGAIWGELGKRTPVYASHGCPDKSADGMFEYCKKGGMDWGAMDSMPDLPGVAVRYSGHVGVYVGNGEVVEWRGFKYGCVVTKLKDRKWLHWYRLPWTEYLETSGENSGESEAAYRGLGERLLKRGMKGEDVKLMQDMLMRLGYKLVRYGSDGDFGSETEEAVKTFQRREGLNDDGKYGNLTHRALMARIAEIEDEDEGDRDAGETEGGQGPTSDGESAGLPSVPGAAGAVTGEIEVTGRTVNVREGAGTSYDVITVVRKGDVLQAVATAGNGWHCVRLGDKMGWISGKYTRMREAVRPTSAGKSAGLTSVPGAAAAVTGE